MAIELDTHQTYDARIRVVGVGGGGGNAVRTMIMRGLEGVEFIAANTDHQALMNNPASVKIQLGTSITRGLGAGANPERGRQAVEESMEDVRDALAGSDMVFVTAGMGGGTGTGAAPVIAKVGREIGALVVAIVTKPFAYESKKRMQIAEHGLKELREHVDALIVIPNQRILSIVDKDVSFMEALAKVDNVLFNATKGIADIISGVGYVNVDFADVRTVMANMGDALMGIGMARGEHRAIEAATSALNSPILEGMSIYGSQGLLVNITGGNSMTMHEVSEAVSYIEKAAGDDVNLIHGVVIDERMEDEIAITVVATGFRREEVAKPAEKITMNDVRPAVRPMEQPRTEQLQAEQETYQLQTETGPAITVVRTSQEAPRGADSLQTYDVPAYVRRAQQQQGTGGAPQSNGGIPISSMPPVVPSTSGIKSASGGEKPAFLRKIMD
ncbi:cell division protein FtsZ [soil metagenome]